MLLVSGFSLLVDSNRILISRLIGANSDTLLNLSHPFFYYIAFGLAAAGLILIFVSLIGCWATCLNNYCVLGIVCKMYVWHCGEMFMWGFFFFSCSIFFQCYRFCCLNQVFVQSRLFGLNVLV